MDLDRFGLTDVLRDRGVDASTSRERGEKRGIDDVSDMVDEVLLKLLDAIVGGDEPAPPKEATTPSSVEEDEPVPPKEATTPSSVGEFDRGSFVVEYVLASVRSRARPIFDQLKAVDEANQVWDRIVDLVGGGR